VTALHQALGRPVFVAELGYPAAKMQGVFNWNDAVASYPLSPRGQADFIRDLWHGAFTAVFSLAFELGLPILPALGTDVDVRAEWQDRSCLPALGATRSYSGRTLSQRATKHSEAGAEATGRKTHDADIWLSKRCGSSKGCFRACNHKASITFSVSRLFVN